MTADDEPGVNPLRSLTDDEEAALYEYFSILNDLVVVDYAV